MSSCSSTSSQVAETDPTGQYERYNEMLGEGFYKKVYKGFDNLNGMEIAWCRIKITTKMSKSDPDTVMRLCTEACLVKNIHHENIVKCYRSWIDYENKIIHIITELFTSMTMRQYIMNHVLVDVTAVKKWCRQILNALDYLHTRNPPILHRDVKVENMFVCGNSGTVKLGDFGVATVLKPGHGAVGVFGTAQYMAPEIFRGNYNQLVDIHSFGICVLQMVTGIDKLYGECTYKEQIYKEIMAGVRPEVLSTVTDTQAKQFIERCLSPAYKRPSAKELLNDPFLGPSVASTSTVRTNLSLMPCSIRDQVDRLVGVEKEVEFGDRKVNFLGKMKDRVMIRIVLSIIYNVGGNEVEEMELEFSIQKDKVDQFVMKNIAKQLELSTEDVAVAIEIMDQLIKEVMCNQNSAYKGVLNAQNLSDEDPFSSYYEYYDDKQKSERMSNCFGKLSKLSKLRTFSWLFVLMDYNIRMHFSDKLIPD
ncbi:serine/threonine-protein kinase WNK8-like [Spinacia oleracea]|uniref:non-specific serine/threonine protein kinase n=1 Tax=Spinacia oleracea TaxID=3562 RepID=A0A9R0JDA8_SPIOL|nr:serine/threonine-protein kinase WNK8-like [Spinacia oleracea]